jgi:hypothetical protein
MNLYVEAQTSPIGRGVRVKRRLLCEDIHPPPNVNAVGGDILPIDDPNKYSNRFLVENKTRPGGCQGCHASINSIGFALDFYDSLGRFRTDEVRYDAKGNVANTFPLSQDIDLQLAGRRVTGGAPLAVARQIADSERGSACFVGHWLSFAEQSDRFGQDSCLKAALHGAVRSGGAGVVAMFRQAARAELDAVKDLGGQP